MIRPLSAAALELLEFERVWHNARTGPKAAAISERFGDVGPEPIVAYYARLNRVLSDPAADLYDPELVRRLRRVRDKRRTRRRPTGRTA